MITINADWIDQQLQTLRAQQKQVEAQYHSINGAIELLEKQRALLQNGQPEAVGAVDEDLVAVEDAPGGEDE